MSKPRGMAKWGFGMASISERMRARYDAAVQTGVGIMEDDLPLEDIDLDNLSELKGMFNRCLRQDQWDWFSVHSELGRPETRSMDRIVRGLVRMRKALKENDADSITGIKEDLVRAGLLTCLRHYRDAGDTASGGTDGGWIYILSTREQPSVLKIGMTRRSVEQRTKEINSATGVLIPFSARRVFRVTDAALAERRIFEALQPYRIRQDREFFEIPFGKASSLIEECLNEIGLKNRKHGTVAYYDAEKRYGFIDSEENSRVFFHLSQVSDSDVSLIARGASANFDIAHSPKGEFARNVVLRQLPPK